MNILQQAKEDHSLEFEIVKESLLLPTETHIEVIETYVVLSHYPNTVFTYWNETKVVGIHLNLAQRVTQISSMELSCGETKNGEILVYSASIISDFGAL